MKNKIEEILGHCGTMISQSKSGYRDRHPDNLVVFNANLFVDGVKAWFGDIDITKSKKKLIELSECLEKEIKILSEMDGRFENEFNPNLNKFIVNVTSDGEITLNESYKDRYKI